MYILLRSAAFSNIIRRVIGRARNLSYGGKKYASKTRTRIKCYLIKRRLNVFGRSAAAGRGRCAGYTISRA